MQAARYVRPGKKNHEQDYMEDVPRSCTTWRRLPGAGLPAGAGGGSKEEDYLEEVTRRNRVPGGGLGGGLGGGGPARI